MSASQKSFLSTWINAFDKATFRECISWNVASLNTIAQDMMKSLHYKYWAEKWKYFYVPEVFCLGYFE